MIQMKTHMMTSLVKVKVEVIADPVVRNQQRKAKENMKNLALQSNYSKIIR